jgi:protein-disulfide isomerase/uncharacterized membrane protein
MTNTKGNRSINDHFLNIPHTAMFLFSLAMIAVSFYLTQNYFEAKYPTGLGQGSLCNISSFFNCDITTNSPFSNIMNVPISIFGGVVGLFFLIGCFYKNKALEGTNHNIAKLNAIGCIALFIYSLVALGGLCPFCSLYYVLSIGCYIAFWKSSDQSAFDIKVLGTYAIVAAIAAGSALSVVDEKEENQRNVKGHLLSQYTSLPVIGSPENDVPYRIASATEDFKSAPLQITVFSDFQCPACKMLSELMAPIAKKYQGKVNIQYSFYPLDINCNVSMKRSLHEYACKAAYLASCVPKEKFLEVHDDIFKHQADLSHKWLDDYAQKEGVTDCVKSKATKENIVNIIKGAEKFKIRSTPSMLINGVKIEGVLPLGQIFIILDHLLTKNGQ